MVIVLRVLHVHLLIISMAHLVPNVQTIVNNALVSYNARNVQTDLKYNYKLWMVLVIHHAFHNVVMAEK